MIDALITGKLFKAAEARTSKNGNTFVTATLTVADADQQRQFVKVTPSARPITLLASVHLIVTAGLVLTALAMQCNKPSRPTPPGSPTPTPLLHHDHTIQATHFPSRPEVRPSP